MRLSLSITALILSLQNSNGQQKDTFMVRAGDRGALMKSIYAYPAFQWGKVYFVSGDSSKARMNYHLFLEKMLYIGAGQDTLALANDASIRAIIFDKDIYVFKRGQWLRVSAIFGNLHLAERNTVRLLDEQRIGAYGIPSSTQSIESKSSFREHDARLLLGANLVFRKEQQLYFSPNGSWFENLSRKKVLDLFHKYRRQIEKYMDDHDINLKKEDQVRSLFAYIASLL